MTLVARRPSGAAAPSLPPVLPDLGFDIDHFWHPGTFTTGDTEWVDVLAGLPLLVVKGSGGTAARETWSNRPAVALSNAVARCGLVGQKTVLAVGYRTSGYANAGSATILSSGNARLGINSTTALNTTPSNGTGTLAESGPGTWDQYAISQPDATHVDYAAGVTKHVGATVASWMNTLRVGSNQDTPTTDYATMRIGAIITSPEAVTADALIALRPVLAAWWPAWAW